MMDQLIRPLEHLFFDANAEALNAEELFEKGFDHAVRAGELLSEAKARVKHGEWLPLLHTHWRFGESTARRYMQLAREQEKVRIEGPEPPSSNRSRASDLGTMYVPKPISQRQALEILKPKVPEIKEEPPIAAKALDDVGGRMAKYIWNGPDVTKLEELIKHRDQYTPLLWETTKDALRRSISRLTNLLREMESD